MREHGRARWLAGAFLAAALLPGCADPGEPGGPGGPPAAGATAEARRTVPPRILAGVPDVVQSTDYSCGCAAMVAVLGYYGIAADEKELIREGKVDPEVGVELEDLAEIARRRKLEPELREHLTLDDLAREVEAGRPVIILNQSWRTKKKLAWRDAWDDGHYLVVLGLDARFVYVEDPSLEGVRGRIARAEFVERWHGWTKDERKTEGQGLLIRGPRKPPPAPAPAVEKFEPVE